MILDIKVPAVGESISEVTLAKWLKNEGDYVERDEVIAELESEKATFEINAIEAGILHLVASEGDILKIGDTACNIDTRAEKPNQTIGVPKSDSASVALVTPAPASSISVVAPVQSEIQVKATPVAAAL